MESRNINRTYGFGAAGKNSLTVSSGVSDKEIAGVSILWQVLESTRAVGQANSRVLMGKLLGLYSEISHGVLGTNNAK